MAEKHHVGIFGGTFDPIHLGHLLTAEAVRDEFGLDKVIFIPAAQPPHKQDQFVTEAHHRLAMTTLATCSNPHFMVSDIELHRDGPSYSRDTLAVLSKLYGSDTEFYFIVGADSLQDLHTWSRPEELLQLCHLIGASRPKVPVDLAEIQSRFGRLGKEKIHVVTTPEIEISSTDIRERLLQGDSIKYLVPEAVEQYIYKEKLYLQIPTARGSML